MRTLAFSAVLLTACFNFDADYYAYCARTGRCDGGTATGGGGGSAAGGSAGGAAQGGGTNAGGGTSAGGGSAAGGTAQGGGTGGGGGTGNAMCAGVNCTNPINGSSFCDAGTCDFNCNATYHRCGFSCVGDNNGAACGPMCVVCPNLGFPFMRSCDAGVCDFGCTTGYQRCGTQCLPANSAQACGPACAVCSTNPGTSPFCDAGTCDFNCQNGFMKMGGACVAPPVLTFPNIADVADPNTFIDARLDPSVKNVIWALDFGGQLLVSNDFGVTPFTAVCRLPNSGLNSSWSGFAQRSTTRILLSHGPDRTAYVVAPYNGSPYNGHLYRADMSSGTCTDITAFGPAFSYLWTTQWDSSAAVAGDGTLFEFDSDSNGSRLRRSGDRGASWGIIDAGSLGIYQAGYLNGGPGSDLFLSLWNMAGTQALYLFADGGQSMTRVSPAIYSSADLAVRPSWVYAGEVYANRGNAPNDGFLSVNGGQSWSQLTVYGASNDWALDPVSNAGYRFNVYDGGVNVERSNDMHAPAWARTNIFFPGFSTVQYDRLDAANGQVAAVVDQRLYLSGDNGATWRRVGSKPSVVSGGALDSIDGTTVYFATTQTAGVPYSVSTYASVDKGVTFNPRFSGPVPNAYDPFSVRVNPLNATNVLAFANNPSGPTYNPSMIVSHDGFVTVDAGSTGASNYNSALTFSPASAVTSYFLGPTSTTSVNSGDTYSALVSVSFPAWQYPYAQATHDGLHLVAMECSINNRAWRVDLTTHITTDITTTVSNALSGDVPCSGELYFTGSAWRLRAIGQTGWLATSDDDGATFNTVSGATGGLPTCTDRHILSLGSDRTVIVSWCASLAYGRIWVSRNNGQSWTEPTAGANWTAYQCDLNSLAMNSTTLIAGCSSRPPVLIAY